MADAADRHRADAGVLASFLLASRRTWLFFWKELQAGPFYLSERLHWPGSLRVCATGSALRHLEDNAMGWSEDNEPPTPVTDAGASSCVCCLSRRRFLAVFAAAAISPTAAVSAQAPTGSPAAAKRIDVHHHFLPPQYMKEEHERISFGHGGVSARQMLSWTPSQSLALWIRTGSPPLSHR